MIDLSKTIDWLGKKGNYFKIMILAGIIGSTIAYSLKGIDYASEGYMIGFLLAGVVEILLFQLS